MTYQSNLSAVTAKLRAARFAGLIAAAEVVINAVKEGLRGGFTTGLHVTGASVSAVNRSEPEESPNGASILVGTHLMYNLYWELGFVPARGVFSPGLGRNTQGPIGFQRKEVWMPAFLSTRQAQMAAYQRAFARVWGGGGGSGRVAASPRSPR